MVKAKLLAVLAAVAIFLPAPLFAEEITEDEIVEDDSGKIYIDEEDERTFLQRGKHTNLLATSLGYDNNTFLDSRRHGDVFNQTYFRTTFASPVTRDKRVTGILEYELMALLYAGESNLDIIKNGFHAALENKINETWETKGGYRLNIYSYISSKNDTFVENLGYYQVRQNLPAKFYHQLGYELGFRNYPNRHIRISAAVDSDKKREDLRNTVSYEIGKYFPKDLYRIVYEYYNNNSNEKYLNYYDYDSSKVTASLTHLFSDKFFSLLSFARQFRDYRSRTLIQDAGSKEWDKTYLLAAALYYNLTKSLTLGLSYTYRENVSNEPIENYSGSLYSVSAYYRF